MPKLSEYAEILVEGMRFRDWTSVKVYLPRADTRRFWFTLSEAAPPQKTFSLLRLRPGMRVQIYLAGQLAISGFITIRQAAYDANSHAVRIEGENWPVDLQQSSVLKPEQFKGYTWEAIAKKVLQPYGIGLVLKGSSPDISKPFENETVQPGESPWNFLDRLGRSRGLTLTDDAQGNLVAIATGTGEGGQDALVEGKNILRAVAVISDFAHSEIQGAGQMNGTDKRWGKDAAQPAARVTNPNVMRYRPLYLLSEKVSTPEELKARLNQEVAWETSAEIQANIVVQGWLQSSGKLWEPDKMVKVTSPMLMLDMELQTESVTFTQDNTSGTLTTLALMKPGKREIEAGGMNPGSKPVPEPQVQQPQ